MKRLLLIVFLVGIMLMSMSCEPTENNTNTTQNNSASSDIKDMAISIVDGDDITLNSLKGKIVIIDFWASWCGPCKNSIPFYNEMHEKYADQGLVIIGMDVNEPEATIKKAKEELGISYMLGNQNNAMNAYFKVSSIPSMFMFDREGNMIQNFVGYSSAMDAQIEQLITDNL